MTGSVSHSEAQSAVKPTTVRFSVVTPTWNAATFLNDCLESVQSQSTSGIEIEHLVLDGGSTDGTLEILRDRPGVRQLAREPGSSLVSAMSRGYEQATGDLVGYLGADDSYLPHVLSRAADIYRRERRDVIFGGVQWSDGAGAVFGQLSAPPWWLTAEAHASLGWNYLGAANIFVTPQLYRRLGGFDESFTKAEDYEFYTRILAEKIPWSRFPGTVCNYRRHGNNDSLDRNDAYTREVDAVLDRFGPKNPWRQRQLRWLLKSWIYLRHPMWAVHQMRAKLQSRSLTATG